jgi:hypothetical protein
MAQKTRRMTTSICFVGGLLTFAPSSAAYPAECFPGPDFQAPRGARWEYRRDSMPSQGCWYLKQTGPVSRRDAGKPSPHVGPPRSVAFWNAPWDDKWDFGAPRPSQPFSAWFWSEFGSRSNFGQAYTGVQGEAATGEPSLKPKRRHDNAPITQKKPLRNKTEKQNKVAQRKSEDASARAQGRYVMDAVSLLEAAGDKPVSKMPALMGQDLKKAIEAVGDKDVVTAPADLKEDWQKTLYAEFLRWRANQFMLP